MNVIQLTMNQIIYNWFFYLSGWYFKMTLSRCFFGILTADGLIGDLAVWKTYPHLCNFYKEMQQYLIWVWLKWKYKFSRPKQCVWMYSAWQNVMSDIILIDISVSPAWDNRTWIYEWWCCECSMSGVPAGRGTVSNHQITQMGADWFLSGFLYSLSHPGPGSTLIEWLMCPDSSCHPLHHTHP